MIIETPFEKLCKDVYKTIGLEYKPTKNEEDEIVEVDCDVRRFSKKTKSYPINKENLRVHYASKKLSKFIEESERKRRMKEEDMRDTDQLHKKGQVLDFINQLTAKAKIEKQQRDNAVGYKAEEIMVDALQELTHVTGVMKADKMLYEEQKRRVSELHENGPQSQAIHMIHQMSPVHEQLNQAFVKGHGDQKQALHHAISSEGFEPISPTSSGDNLVSKKSIEINSHMKILMAGAKYNPAVDPNDTIIPNDVMHGVGHIGQTFHKCDKNFQDSMQKVRRNTETKHTMQNELIYKTAAHSMKGGQKSDKRGYEHERKMTVVLDSLVHKAKGREVEKMIAESREEDKINQARRSTLDKIEDYGRRMSVVQDAKDTSYTKIKHDAKSQKVFDGILTSIQPATTKTAPGKAKTGKARGQPGLKTVSNLRKSSIISAPADHPNKYGKPTTQTTSTPAKKTTGSNNTMPKRTVTAPKSATTTPRSASATAKTTTTSAKSKISPGPSPRGTTGATKKKPGIQVKQSFK